MYNEVGAFVLCVAALEEVFLANQDLMIDIATTKDENVN